MYIARMQGIVDMEAQPRCRLARMSVIAGPSGAGARAGSPPWETGSQRQRLESILQSHGAAARAYRPGHAGADPGDRKDARDGEGGRSSRAGLIASAQKLEHYEIAAYGTAAALAGQLQMRTIKRWLHESLEEEERWIAKLTHSCQGRGDRDALAPRITVASREE